MSSILTDTKKLLGITEEYENFDLDIITHINSVFSILCQLGVGPKAGFSITDKASTWEDFLPNQDPRLNMVKSYMYAKVRLMFDPPQSGSHKEALEATVDELTFRLSVQVDPGNSFD